MKNLLRASGVFALLASLLASLPAFAAPATGYWWNPAEPGRGFVIEVQNNSMFMAGFLYAANGEATWVASSGAMTSPTQFSGPLITYNGGQTLTGSFQPATQSTPALGTIAILFTSDTTGTVTWPGGTTPIQRFDFGPGGSAAAQPAGTPEAGWWWAPAEGGRGYAIEVQGGAMYLAGYMYDAAGNPLWYLASGNMRGTGSFSGEWQQFANGQTLTGSFQASAVANASVGSVTLQFTNPREATLTFPNGRQVVLTRFAFAGALPPISVSSQETLVVGATTQLATTAYDGNGNTTSTPALSWGTSDATVATVSSSGLVTGVFPGSVTITATGGGGAGSTGIQVVAPTLAMDYNGLTGYFTSFPTQSPLSPQDGWGMSMYSAVYPSLKPQLSTFTQLGWGTWLVPNTQVDANGLTNPRPPTVCSPGAAVPSLFQSIEGGVGSWASVKYPVAQPMFTINATADCYTTQMGGPAYTFNADAALNANTLYFAQLSNQFVLPPGAVVFQNPVQPSLFGYGWLALPIIPANISPYGIPTGGNSWTLFLNTANFKGAVGFFTPAYWTSINQPQNPWLSVGYGMDTRNTDSSGTAALEVGFTASFTASDAGGNMYRRVPRLTFTTDQANNAVLIQDYRRYFKSALWDSMAAWINGGAAPAQINTTGVFASTMTQQGQGLRMLNDTSGNQIALGTAVQASVTTTTGGGSAFGLKWDGSLEAGVLPEYYKLVSGVWTPVAASQVPRTTWLIDQTFPQMPRAATPVLNTASGSPWAPGGWAAGPFSTLIGNGSTVDYVWYRFVDQPAISRLPLSTAQRATLQAWAVSVHAQGSNGLTIAPPSSGQLVAIDHALFVTPPAGMEKGYVPIAIGQH